MNKTKEPLYRKVNTRVSRRCALHHDLGGDHRHERHTKTTKLLLEEGVTRSSMGKKVNRGLDYRPLFRFLLSKVGEDWTAVHSEAVSRLDRPDPISWMVAEREEDQRNFICGGETAFFNGLYVDADNKLQKVKPDLCASDLNKDMYGCTCCTYTLNGVPFVNQAMIDQKKGMSKYW